MLGFLNSIFAARSVTESLLDRKMLSGSIWGLLGPFYARIYLK